MGIYLSTNIYEPKNLGEVFSILEEVGDPSIGIEILPEWQDPVFEEAMVHYKEAYEKRNISFHGPYYLTEHSQPRGTEVYKRSMMYFKETLALAETLDSKYIVYHHNNEPIKEEEKKERIKVAKENLKEINELAKEYGVPIVIENAGVKAKGTMLFDEKEFIALAKGSKNKILIDIGHAHANGWHLEHVIEQLKDQIVAYHVHNNNGKDDEHKRMEDGTLDMHTFWRLYRTYTPEADIVIEYGKGCQKDREGIIADLKKVKRLLEIRPVMDLHTHTVASGHAYSTLKENIEAAKARGLQIMGTSDHYQVPPMESIPYLFENYKVLRKEIEGVRVLRGAEVNIIDYNGALDMLEHELRTLDYAIASLHMQNIASGTKEENTEAVLGAIRNPYVQIIGHLDDGNYPVDYERIVKEAKAHNVALEINNASIQPHRGRKNAYENAKQMLELCKAYGVYVIIGSDSHIYYDIGEMTYSIDLLQAIDFPIQYIVNTDEEKLGLIGITVN
ncbi:MAG: PHP domain-containing protein [Cellulosilyticaceae bacterium]